MEIKERYMRRALALARNGLLYAHPNPMVGAVIVAPDGTILGEGYHRKCGEAHAEVNAINAVEDKEALKDSTMYVTLEPCAHYGRTAPCADLIVRMGIPRVVIGSRDPFDKVDGKGIDRLREAGVEVAVGVMEEECRKLNSMFFTAHEKKRPYIMLKWAKSADGFMDMLRDAYMPPAEISTPLTRMLLHRARAYFDAILIGSGTYISDTPQLNVRLWPGPNPRPIILDRRGRIKKAEMPEEPIIIRDHKPLAEIMHDLYLQNINSLIVEGGAQVLKSFLTEGLWDLIRVETSPESFGEFGIVPAPKVYGYEPMLTRLYEGQTIKYYSQNPLIDVKNL